ncbi:MAG: hypothetical protein LBT09_10220 [Planctomycetaceae bacterium]|jgi:hypothetical protein|nr:hypothetical protein [Planctomycetaceae bacterium]
MKKTLFFSKITVASIAVLVLFAFCFLANSTVSAQNQYRRPSKSDVEWLLGNNNKSKLPNRSTINFDENIEDNIDAITPAVFRSSNDLPEPCQAVTCSKNGSKLKNPNCRCEYCGEPCNVEPCGKTKAKPIRNPQKIKQINFPTTPQPHADKNENDDDNAENNFDNEQLDPPIVAVDSGFPAKSNAVNATLNNKNSHQATIEFAAQKPTPIETDAIPNNSNSNNIKVKIAYPDSDPIHLTTPQTNNIPNPQANAIALSARPERQHNIQPTPQQHAKQKIHKNKTNLNTDCNCENFHDNTHDPSCHKSGGKFLTCKKNIYGNDCPCDSCSGSVGCDSGEIVAETCVGILFRQINRLRYTRLKHDAKHNGQCNCWLCANLDNPDMTGNGIWNLHRVAEFGNVVNSATDISSLHISPNMFLSRPDISTHFNAETRSRVWADFRQFNNAAATAIILPNGNAIVHDRTINLFTFGFERRIGMQTSLEIRVPLLYQFDSDAAFSNAWRNLHRAGSSELGNITLSTKYVFARTKKITLAAGLGVALPTADDWSVTNFDAAIENKAYNIVSFLAAQWHPNDSTFGHLFFQADIPASKNEIRFGELKSKIEESQILQIGVQLGRWFYRNEYGMYSCRIGGFVEIDYAVAVNSADNVFIVKDNNFIGVNSTENKPDNLNFTAGLPITVGQLSVNNAVIVPLSNNRQFSIAYNFSICRKF